MKRRVLIETYYHTYIQAIGVSIYYLSEAIYSQVRSLLIPGADVTHFLPPLASYVCTYVRAWVQVKHFWNLTIDAAEQVTLQTQLANC